MFGDLQKPLFELLPRGHIDTFFVFISLDRLIQQTLVRQEVFVLLLLVRLDIVLVMLKDTQERPDLVFVDGAGLILIEDFEGLLKDFCEIAISG